ncbi:TIGR02678 family protein [Modestobacter sp. I12A-02628]|uniref:TIGR02678 family protein n=1 Tax=Goekera deserti TaxID=2497753 RepID=A0A7K3WKT0_9ACTN|nr:TIGR02678 family protein [Goekera deserti]MPQ96385.1 TIGR02678 family protein [Goekera deserti]NDI47303.1 TIGR02678 family protein [Goekera deserti]NEL56133.1 TIGR02678 family protein [Goekera deserti]
MTAPQPPREVTERRDAARALLHSPFLTDGDALPLVRRHAAALKTTFATWLGYTLYVEPAFARLIKTPLTADAPTRPARRTAGGEFTPRTYVYLTLLSAALLAPQTGEQILVSALVEQVRADAATAQVTLDDSYADQRHLLAAFRQLIGWGVLEETAGSVAEWSERREEALLTIHRQMLPHLLARPLTYDDPMALLSAAPDVVEQPRRSLRRKLVENPLVRREDLTDAERDVLSRERTELTRVLDETFGLMLEVRAEGALAYDPDSEVTDLEFPGASTVRQAALLTVDELLARHTPKSGSTADVGGRAVPGVLCPWPEVGDVITGLSTRHGKAWGAEYVTDPARLQAEVVATLTAFGLATGTDAGLVLHPAAARHRPTVSQTPPRTRAQTRLIGDPDQVSLFDPETP